MELSPKFRVAALLLIALTTLVHDGTTTKGEGNTRVVQLECGVSQRRGRRIEMEDRSIYLCFGESGMCYAGIYDGHEGSEASQFLADEFHSRLADEMERLRTEDPDAIMDASRRILHEIDAEYLSLAQENGWGGGSTVVFALLADDRVLFGNVGNSKAIACKRAENCKDLQMRSTHRSSKESLVRLETEDHHPGRQDERRRIEAAGQRVQNVKGTWRLNGELELSRAIGDLPYRDKGLIPEPEFLGWYSIQPGDGFLVLASDGVFEVMSPEDVCEHAESERLSCRHPKRTPWPDPPIALAGRGFDECVLPHDEEEYRRLDYDPEEAPLNGIINCCDCRWLDRCTNEPMSHPPSLEYGIPWSTEQRIAHRVATEAYNRRSMDNIAVSVLDLSVLVDESTTSPVAWPEGNISAELEKEVDLELSDGPPYSFPWGFFPQDDGYIIRSPQGDWEYSLTDKIAVIPGSIQQQWHVHWDVSTLPLPHQDTMIGSLPAISSDNNFQPNLADDSQSLTLFEGSELAIPLLECLVHPPQLTSDTQLDDTCKALFTFDSLTHPIIQALGSLPLSTVQDQEDIAVQDSQTVEWSFDEVFEVYADYRLQKKFAAGSFGEVWRAVRTESGMDGMSNEPYVLKRLMVEKGPSVLLSGLREEYFGELFEREASGHVIGDPQSRSGYDHLVRFVESFESEPGPELWLIFHDEGVSLHSMMYDNLVAPDQSDSAFSGLSVVEPSAWWWKLRKNRSGDRAVKEMLHQLLLALRVIHRANVTHRDVKPENILLRQVVRSDPFSVHLRLIDFGSAIDNYTLHNLYGDRGPSDAEQTVEYAPPEARFGRLNIDGRSINRTWTYDMWSLGIVWLELILGTPHIFHLPARTRALLDQKLKISSLPEVERERAYLLRAMMEFCIYPTHTNEPPQPKDGTSQDGRPPSEELSGNKEGNVVSWSCSEDALMQIIKSRDPAGRGLPNKRALRLLMAMLAWEPNERITAGKALESPYFKDD